MERLAHAALRRDRAVVGLGLTLVAVLAWAYLAHMGSMMPAHTHHHPAALMAHPAPAGWDWQALGLAASMWLVMLAAMMLPTASPMILTFARVHRQRGAAGAALSSTAVFVAGYLTVWGAFSLAAATGQLALHEAALLSSPMGRVDALAGGVLLILAGVFQWSPLKTICLEKCRAPIAFLLAEWREGRRGAFVMGLRHGAFCTGCCWALMLLMFVGGVMNLAWMAALGIYMLAEKVVPHGLALTRITGGLFVAAGLWIVGAALLA